MIAATSAASFSRADAQQLAKTAVSQLRCVKPLEALAGATILGAGDVALVLDLQGLMAAAMRPGATAAQRS